jgi:hypothetical protein
MTGSLDQLVIYCRENGRVCPVPQQRNRSMNCYPTKGLEALGGNLQSH